MRLMLAAPLVLCTACIGDETLSGYAGAGSVWGLEEADGLPTGLAASLSLPRKGRIAGAGPCGAFEGAQTAPYPWFAAEDLTSCPGGDDFTEMLAAMTLSEVQGDILILSCPDGREMVFSRQV